MGFVPYGGPTQEELNQVYSSQDNPPDNRSFLQRAKDDIYNTTMGYINTAKEDWNRLQQSSQEAQRVLYDPNATGDDLMNSVQQGQQNYQQLKKDVVEPIIVPAAMIPGPQQPFVAAAAAPFILEGAYDSYQRGGLGQVARDFTYGPIKDFVTDPNLGQKFHDRPVSTAVEGVLDAAQIALPLFGVKSIAERVKEGMRNDGLLPQEAPKYDAPQSSDQRPQFEPQQTEAPQPQYDPNSIDGMLHASAVKYGVPENLLRGVAKAESGFDPKAESPAGAMGVMQLMPETARGLGVENAWDPRQNIDGGAKYLRQLMDIFPDDINKVIAAYNAGPEAVKKYGGIPPYEETQTYVKRVLANAGDISNVPSRSPITDSQRVDVSDPIAEKILNDQQSQQEVQRTDGLIQPDTTEPNQPKVPEIKLDLLNTDNPLSPNSLLLRASHEAAMRDDYGTAYKLAMQAGRPDFAEQWKTLGDVEYKKNSSNNKSPLQNAEDSFNGQYDVGKALNNDPHYTGMPVQDRIMGDALTKIDQPKVNDFVDRALSSRQKFETLSLRKTTPYEVERIKNLTGIDTTGFSHEIDTNNLRHALNQHGDATLEANRKSPQLPITAEDLKQIPQIINSFDNIKRGSDSGPHKSIVYEKQLNGINYYVETIMPKQGVLRSKTMWKKPSSADRAVSDPPYTSPSSEYALQPERSLTSSKSNYSVPNNENLVNEIQPISKQEILNRINNLYTTVRTGRVRSGVLGLTNHNTGIVRVRNYGDLDTITHEVGHLLDRSMNLRSDSKPFHDEFARAVQQRFGDAYKGEPPSTIRGEGIAEFFHDYVNDPRQAQSNFPNYYSAFEKAISDHPEYQSKVDELRGMVQRWNQQSPEARGRSGVSYEYENKPSILDRGKDAWYKFQENVIDDKVGLAKFTSEFEKATGEKLITENDPYKMARLAHNSAVSRAQMLTDGTKPELVQKVLNQIYGGSVEHAVTVKSILDGLKPLNKLHPDYLKKGNFKNWQEALDTLLVARRQIELQKYHPDYKGPMPNADATAIVKNAPKQLHDLAQKVYQYNDNILNILTHEGMVKPEVRDALREKYQNYVPMGRDFTDEAAVVDFLTTGKGFGNIRNPLKSISETGSSRQVISPLESMIKNTYVMLNLAERNRVGQIFAELAQKPGVGKLIERVPGTSSAKESVFSVWKEGVKESYQTTPELYRAIMSMNRQSGNFITDILSTPAGWLRAGATLTPDFALKNLFRDTFSALVFSRHGFVPVVDHLKALAHMLKKDELYHEYKASGALMSTMVGLDRNYTYESMQKLIQKSWKQRINPVQYLRAFSDAIETATRLGEYGKARSNGASMADAALSARDVTLDFSKSGVMGNKMNKISAFFNAAVQEPVRLTQAFKENPYGTSAKIGLYIVTPSVLLWTMNHDQDWYKELPSYQKDLFWVFKAGDTVYRIPKPFGLGVLFGSGTERMLDWMYDRDPKTLTAWAKTTFNAFTPNILPTAAAPLLEWVTNYSFFTERDIVPSKEQKLPNAMQFGPNTSGLAKLLGQTFDLSPRKIDNLFQGYGGGMARQTLNAADALTGQRPMEYPFTKAFTVDPYKSPQSIQSFYDALGEAEKNYNASKITNPGPKGKGNLTGNDKRNYEVLTKANDLMSKMNKEEREIIRSNLSQDQKEAKVRQINIRQTQLAQAALKQIRK